VIVESRLNDHFFPMRNLPRCLILVFLLHVASLILLSQESLSDQYYSGKYRWVKEQAAHLIQSGDTSFNTFYLKVLSEAQLGLTTETIESLELALAYHRNDRRFQRILAAQLFEAGYYLQAREIYLVLVQTDSTDVSSWMKLAEIASFRQQYDQATDALEQVLMIDSLNLESLMMMGEIFNRHNNSGAVVFYEKAWQLYPDNQKAAYALANLKIQQKKASEALPVCDHILSFDSTSIKFRKLKGYTHYKMGEPHRAIVEFRLATELGDSSAFSFKYCGISQYLAADFEGAIESLQLAVERDSADAENHFFLGSSLATTKEKTKAMNHLNRSLKLMQPDPSIVSRIYSEQGNIKRLEMEYEEAYKLYNRAYEADTTNPLALYFMASILDNSLHHSKEALAIYERYMGALATQPGTENQQSLSIKTIVEDRIISLREELFFRDED